VAFLVISFFFGLAGGIIGRIKGSSFLLWFLISAIPPYVGLLAALLFRFERDEPRRDCPGCGRSVPVYAAICTRCGTELEFPEPVPGPGPAAVH
jgi:hypothetical protein